MISPDDSLDDNTLDNEDDEELSEQEIAAEHAAMLAGDELAKAMHDPDECYDCLLTQTVSTVCRCAQCCRRLLIEVGLEDAKREPRIAEFGSPIYTDARLTGTGQAELVGYLLNTGNNHDCAFLDQDTNLCRIHETRPLVCRLFNCDGDDREHLVQIGILDRKEAS